MTAAAALLLSVASAVPAHATAGVTIARISGPDRYATAAQIAITKFPTGVGTALLASGLNFPDALAGGYLAGLDVAPILLTDPKTLSDVTKAALATLKVRNVVILGGTNAVVPAVQAAVAALTSTSAGGGSVVVTRIAGLTRYDTAQLIDTSAPATSVGVVAGKATAILATGANFADAVAASPVAYHNHFPVVLTDPATLSAQAAATLKTDNIGQVLIMGGTAAVSDGVEQAVNGLGISTLARFAGTDRTDTAQKLATFEVSTLGFTNDEIVLTRGDAFPDALAGGVYAGDPKPILLTNDPDTLGVFTSNYLSANKNTVNKITILGGFKAVSDSTAAKAAAAAGSSTALGGGGGNGGAGGVVPAPSPTTSAPDLVSATVRANDTQLRFDKSIVVTPATASMIRFAGPFTKGQGVNATLCVLDPDGVSVDCKGGGGSNTIAVVDGGAVTSASGGLPNVLNSTTLVGANKITFGGSKLVSATVSSPAFNEITYTFTGTVTLNGANTNAFNAAQFGFVTTDGLTEFFGTSVFTPAGNSVTVRFAPSTPVTQASQFFVLAPLVPKAPPPPLIRNGSPVGNPFSSVGTPPALRPNLVSASRTSVPSQFAFVVDRPSTVTNAGDFLLYSDAGGLPFIAATVVPVLGSSTVFLATFPTVTANNSSQVVGATIAQENNGLTGGLVSLAAPTAVNAVGSVFVGGSTTALVNGPVLLNFVGSIGAGQATFTFDRPINAASVAGNFGNFFVVLNSGAVAAATGFVNAVDNQVTVTFAGVPLTDAVGGGIVAPLGSQPGVNGGLPALDSANTDTAGNPPAPGSVAGPVI